VKEQGFTAAKLRVRAMTIEEDIDQVRTVREAHPGFTLMVDANMGWRVHGFAPYPEWDVARAVRTARALEELEVEWLEEPLDQFDYRGYAELRSKTTVPLAAGEMLSDLHGFRDLIEHRSVDILQPDATLTGGILMARKVAGMAEAAGLAFAPSTRSIPRGGCPRPGTRCSRNRCGSIPTDGSPSPTGPAWASSSTRKRSKRTARRSRRDQKGRRGFGFPKPLLVARARSQSRLDAGVGVRWTLEEPIPGEEPGPTS
jgi:hypothetical protein